MLEVQADPGYSGNLVDVLDIFCEESVTERIDALLRAIDREIFADFKRNLDFPLMRDVHTWE